MSDTPPLTNEQLIKQEAQRVSLNPEDIQSFWDHWQTQEMNPQAKLLLAQSCMCLLQLGDELGVECDVVNTSGFMNYLAFHIQMDLLDPAEAYCQAREDFQHADAQMGDAQP